MPWRPCAGADHLEAPQRRKLIHLVHDLIAAVNPQWTHPHYGKQFLDQFGSLAPAVDHWLVTSTYVGGQLAGYLDQQGLPGRPIDTMPMGWPEPLPIQDDDSVLAKHGLERRRFLLHVGTVEPRKNLDGLFDALGRLRSEEAVSALPCVLVGRDGWRSRKPSASASRTILGSPAASNGSRMRPMAISQPCTEALDSPSCRASTKDGAWPSRKAWPTARPALPPEWAVSRKPGSTSSTMSKAAIRTACGRHPHPGQR